MMFGLKLRELHTIRYIVTALVWATSALVLSLSFVAAKEIHDVKAMLVFVYPWVALLVMSVGWVFDKKVNKFWPITGAIAGTYAFTFGGLMVLFYAPLAFPFAIFLTVFHLMPVIKNGRS